MKLKKTKVIFTYIWLFIAALFLLSNNAQAAGIYNDNVEPSQHTIVSNTQSDSAIIVDIPPIFNVDENNKIYETDESDITFDSFENYGIAENDDDNVYYEFGMNFDMPSDWQDILDSAPMTAGEFQNVKPEGLITGFLNGAISYLLQPLTLFARICAVIVLVSLAKSFVGTSVQSEIMNLLDIVAAISIFTICSVQILQISGNVQSVLTDGQIYLASFVPVFATVMVSTGYVGTSAVYSGVFFGACALITSLFVNIILPFVRVLLAMHMAATVDIALDLSKFAAVVTKWIKWSLTILSAVFVAVLGLQTTLAASADSAALKAGKFLLGSTIPVVGRAVSDAMGSVLAGLKLVKGSMGFAAIAVIVAAVLPAVLQCLGYYITFTLSSFVAGATGNMKTEKMFVGFASCIGVYIAITLLFAAMVTVATCMMIVLGTGG